MKPTLKGRDRIKILFIRPPAPLWPIINESDNFLLPLNFPTLAAYIRREMKGVDIEILDCLPHEIGWKTLERIIGEKRPDVIGLGDATLYAYDGMRVMEIAKRLNPETITIGGGTFYSVMPEYSFDRCPDLDFIVRFEGEETMVDLLETLRRGKDVGRVKGIAYMKDGQLVQTPFRPLIEDLDSLPIPAYDMVPVEKYSPFGKLWPKAATVQASRGCPYNCGFCTWTVTEGAHVLNKDGTFTTKARYRCKSPQRMLEEIDLLYNRYGVRYLFWVDATWNFDIDWLDEFCTGLIERKYKLGWWAFTRADLMLKQEEAGVLEKMVKAGLRHCLFGAERNDEHGMGQVQKNAHPDHFLQASHLLERKYPEVFRQACFLVGIRDESPEKLARLYDYIIETKVDFPAIHPVMPYPGTPMWYEALENGWIEEFDFSKYDMFYPIMKPKNMTRAEVAKAAEKISMDFVQKQPIRYLKGMLSPYPIRRRLYRWFLFAIGRVVARDALQAAMGKKEFEGFAGVNRLWTPSWWDD